MSWIALGLAACGLAGWCRAGAGDGEQRLGAHRQHGVPVEGLPEPDLVLANPVWPFPRRSPLHGRFRAVRSSRSNRIICEPFARNTALTWAWSG